jgi:hypothetical protein
MRHIIETLDPNMKDVLDNYNTTVIVLNTNFNMYDDEIKEYKWYADEYYWIDALWIIQYYDETYKYAVEYKYYTNNEDVVYNYGKQLNYIDAVKNALAEKSKKMEEKQFFKTSKDLSIVMSASKMGFDIENLNIENLEYKAMVLGMLSGLKQTPIIDKKSGKIEGINTQSGGLNSKNIQENLFTNASILFVVCMQDTIIGLNYSEAIRDKLIDLSNPLESTKLTFSAYANKKNRKIKSIGISPQIFTPIKIGKITEGRKYNKERYSKAIGEFVDTNYMDNDKGKQKTRLKNYIYKTNPNESEPNKKLLEKFLKSDLYKKILTDETI